LATCRRSFPFNEYLTIEENLDFFGGVYGVPASEMADKKSWVLSFSGLEGKQRMITGSLPGGWKQRATFGAAIMHEPSVLFLDEPTSGVDPLARRAFWRMINKLADMGTAILVTTHYLEEAEQCNRLGFMVAGELVCPGRSRRCLLQHLPTDHVDLCLQSPPSVGAAYIVLLTTHARIWSVPLERRRRIGPEVAKWTPT